MEEIWKDIPDLKGRFEASDLGRIRDKLKNKIRDVKVLNGSGYKTISLGGIKKSVHYFIAITFLDKIGDVINHKNGIKTDNRLKNLEWCTQRENITHSRRSLKKIGTKLYLLDCVEIIRLSHFGMKTIEIANLFNIHRHSVSSILTNSKWKSSDYEILKECRKAYPPTVRHKKWINKE